jgi:hypothetical protein
MNGLYPLIPRPLAVHTAGFSGRLFIEGSLESNHILFRFRFDNAAELAPLIVKLGAAGKTWRFLCDMRDFTNPDMKSLILKPAFSLASHVTFLGVESLIRNEG